MKRLNKTILIVTIGLVTFLGINFSRNSFAVSGEVANVTLISLGNQANAYCNETGGTSYNDGLCTGPADNPTTRCLAPASITAHPECTR